MSLDVLRSEWLTRKKHEIASLVLSHRRAVQDIATVTAIITSNDNFANLLSAHHDTDNAALRNGTKGTDSLGSDGLLSVLPFHERSIPTPTITRHDVAIFTQAPNTPSKHAPQQAQTSVDAHAHATEAALTKPADAVHSMAATTLLEPHSTLPSIEGDARVAHAKLGKPSQPDGVIVTPAQVAPPAADEEAQFSAATRELLDLESAQRPARTAHLPPEHVQEERKRERDEAMQEGRRKSESGRPTHLQAQTDLASSPSSTVGAYSAATPMPLQDSPDTSPDSAAGGHDILPPKDLRPSPEEQRAKDEHDRLLAAQKEIARKDARGEEATPDDQLRWEARDAAENAAKGDAAGPEAAVMNVAEHAEADEVMEDVPSDVTTHQTVTPAPSQEETRAVDATIAASQLETPAQEDGDNITVVPRARLPHPLDTSRQQRPPPSLPRMTTRVSSGAMPRKSVLDFLGGTPAQSGDPPHARLAREVTSPEAVSPMAMRHPEENAKIPAAVPLQQTPHRATHPSSQQMPNHALVPLNDLAPLKGAAEDPDRDYLEPLFRIQAHDSPQNKWTKALPDLVKVANKSMSTDDQFATLHERMDYRILRRIYHLQNANKWSLRQMERVKEPEQPMTHMDHMMAEMKWMRKDFKAERQMKRSICAWLAARCAECVTASPEEQMALRVNTRRSKARQELRFEEQPPELETSDESAPEDDAAPLTPRDGDHFPSSLIVAPELTELVCDLQKAGTLGKALQILPMVGLSKTPTNVESESLTSVSKFVEGKILPRATGPIRKRSRYEYEDDAPVLDDQPERKRLRGERALDPEEHEVALFHPENKHIRDRLHANNAFRPPSEFAMPSISFYEFRNGSQWIWEDDQKLRKLAKEYSFNWSLIAEEMTLLSRYKSSAERRTPWECFERWVELETLPAEMRKTLYFKTWFQRLEQSQQAAERRYQAQVAAIQSQAQQNGQQAHTPQRRRTVPTRVEKRKNTRYLWLVDAMRKLARKRENNAYKQAEAQRAAAQRKSQSEGTPQQRVQPMLTPQEFSKRRHERDLQIAEAQRQHRQKMLDAQQRQMQMASAARTQGTPNGPPAQQRPGTANAPPQHAQMQANGQPTPSMNGQLPQQARPPLPMATRNGHLAVPQVNAQGIPQAQMRGGPMSHPDMQRLAQANALRNAQYPNQQQYQMPNGHLPSPGGGMTTQQQLQINQQLLAQSSAQQQQAGNVGHGGQSTSHTTNGHQMSASPNMPPPPTPHAQGQQPGQLSSGHVPQLMLIKNQLRNKHPHLSEDQLNQAATSTLREQSQSQSTNQARQNAMNAAAGIPSQAHPSNMQAYAQNQAAFQNNSQMPNGNTAYMNGDNGTTQSPSMTGPSQSPQAVAAYANQLRHRQAQMLRMQQSPNAAHAQLTGSPSMAHASPSMTPASPSMPYSQMSGQMGGMGGRPSSRGNTPQMQRLGSSNSVPGVGMASGMQSPGALPQGSPMQASMAR
ncbi:hypothetical protein LTR36_007880 [Oleoguttula mirabilis]|uniref:Vacuolar import and degradation protein 21 n=1 Tax=Oleoguttula mirabilis TaxID=1507867 RepID=A0AAV9JB11_9PEZI|nr:hypothetical protein LTR36_007880 [Oleoguttula mirabilis]